MMETTPKCVSHQRSFELPHRPYKHVIALRTGMFQRQVFHQCARTLRPSVAILHDSRVLLCLNFQERVPHLQHADSSLWLWLSFCQEHGRVHPPAACENACRMSPTNPSWKCLIGLMAKRNHWLYVGIVVVVTSPLLRRPVMLSLLLAQLLFDAISYRCTVPAA